MGRPDFKSNTRSPTLLIFSPHPDDLELSTGLLCHKAALLGWNIIEIVLTDGAGGGTNPKLFHTPYLIKRRAAEAKASASILGVNSIEFWGYADSLLNVNKRSLERKVNIALDKHNPSLVAFPSIKDMHPDHLSAHQVIDSCLSKKRHRAVQLQYCFWANDLDQNLLLFNRDGVVKKIQAIRAHQSQPIFSYMSRKRDQNLLDLCAEIYYCPNLAHAVAVMQMFGFDVKPRYGGTR